MNIYLLTLEQVQQLQALNTPTVCFVACDYGAGVCVGEHDLDDPAFAAHKALLDSWGLPLTHIQVSSDD